MTSTMVKNELGFRENASSKRSLMRRCGLVEGRRRKIGLCFGFEENTTSQDRGDADEEVSGDVGD